MSQNVALEKPFRWSRITEKAALLAAEDRLTDEEIAERVGVTRRTIIRWKGKEAFQARVAEHVTAFRLAVRSKGIAGLENRLGALQDRWERMKQLIEARAAEHADIPGGQTGLLVRTIKRIGSGDNWERVELFALDTGLLKELREHEKQAAQELGQWLERKDLTSGGEPFKVYAGFDPEKV